MALSCLRCTPIQLGFILRALHSRSTQLPMIFSCARYTPIRPSSQLLSLASITPLLDLVLSCAHCTYVRPDSQQALSCARYTLVRPNSRQFCHVRFVPNVVKCFTWLEAPWSLERAPSQSERR